MADPRQRLQEFLDKIRSDLDNSVRFWLKHSIDKECGGFFICLGEDGHVYDNNKYSWLEGRQVWSFARLYNEVERFRTPEILAAAEHGARFVMAHVKDKTTGKCCLSMTREGLATKVQRTVFSECFYLLAMSEMYRATGTQVYRDEALAMMDLIVRWVREDGSGLGRQRLAGDAPVSSLAVPMMLLCLVDQLTTVDAALADRYKDTQAWCLQQVNKHVQRGGTVVLENVSEDGKELPGAAGRLANPGHAIEAGWFLLRMARAKGDESLAKMAVDTFISASYRLGWDEQHGGLLYFVDVDGESPVQLEWDMKLWWAHNEAMVATLMAYQHTKDALHLQRFQALYDYCYSHFADPAHGDWFGYLNREGKVTHRFKGGPWKGFFHVPRGLMMCEKMLVELINESQ